MPKSFEILNQFIFDQKRLIKIAKIYSMIFDKIVFKKLKYFMN